MKKTRKPKPGPAKAPRTARRSSAGLRRVHVSRPVHARPGVSIVPVVGVGASAGGLEAFIELLRPLPADLGMAVVFVQHLSPTHESTLPAILSKVTSLPVEQVRDGTAVEANHVYVVPPNAELGIERGFLRTSPRPTDRSQYNPIDAFFRSLAQYAESRAFGVLLSGTSSDGVAGLREIRAAGGTVLVQDPETSDYAAMPRAAVSAGLADLVLPPKQIAAMLVRLGAHPLLSPHELGAPVGVGFADHELRRVFAILRNATGVDFSHYKEPTIRRRLHRRMLLQKVSDLAQYVKLLEDTPAEAQNLYQDLLIQVTRFFREPESYKALADTVFPRITQGRNADSPVRIWVPGCATGEEAYSVAMAVLEFLDDSAGSIPFQIFATDVSD